MGIRQLFICLITHCWIRDGDLADHQGITAVDVDIVGPEDEIAIEALGFLVEIATLLEIIRLLQVRRGVAPDLKAVLPQGGGHVRGIVAGVGELAGVLNDEGAVPSMDELVSNVITQDSPALQQFQPVAADDTAGRLLAEDFEVLAAGAGALRALLLVTLLLLSAPALLMTGGPPRTGLAPEPTLAPRAARTGRNTTTS